MAGRGSAAGLLAYGNANEIVKEMALEVLPVVQAHAGAGRRQRHRSLRLMPQFLAELEDDGLFRRAEFPDHRPVRRRMRQSFEETGMGFGLEVDMIAEAHELDLLTTPYVFNPDEARAMTEAGADIIVAHMGVTTGGAIGATSAKSLDDCVVEIDAIADAARSVRKDVIVLCHGGPISMPDDASYILDRCEGLHGFYGASSMERLPVGSRDRQADGGFQGRHAVRRPQERRNRRDETMTDKSKCSSTRRTSAPSASTGAGCR